MPETEPRVALVTGGVGGIGAAVVRCLVASGHRVAFLARHAARITEMLGTERFVTGQVLARPVDVTDDEAAAGFVDEIRQRWGSIDILVNNAGVSPRRTDRVAPWLTQTSVAEWRQVLDINLTGAFIFTRLVAPGMIARRSGRIVNIGSLAGRAVPMIAGPHYAASKAGLIGFTRAAARDLAPFGITVNCIAPGRILTEMIGAQDSEINRAALARIPLARIGRPEEVAEVVAFLVSEAAAFMTAATIDLNGGEFGG